MVPDPILDLPTEHTKLRLINKKLRFQKTTRRNQISKLLVEPQMPKHQIQSLLENCEMH